VQSDRAHSDALALNITGIVKRSIGIDSTTPFEEPLVNTLPVKMSLPVSFTKLNRQNIKQPRQRCTAIPLLASIHMVGRLGGSSDRAILARFPGSSMRNASASPNGQPKARQNSHGRNSSVMDQKTGISFHGMDNRKSAK